MGIFQFMPILSSTHFPAKIKALIAYFVSMLVFFSLPVSSYVELTTDVELLGYLVKEFAIGAVMGLNVALVMEILNFSGSIVSTPMGLSIATAIDPASGEASTTMGQFNTTLGTMLFMILNGHHHAFDGFLKSYSVVGFGEMVFSQNNIDYFIKLYFHLFEASLHISMPILVAMILINFALGVVVRTLPRLNIFMIGIPLQIAVGMITYLITMPFLIKMIKVLYDQGFSGMTQSVKALM